LPIYRDLLLFSLSNGDSDLSESAGRKRFGMSKVAQENEVARQSYSDRCGDDQA